MNSEEVLRLSIKRGTITLNQKKENLKMRFGVATGFENFDSVVKCGYDYFEGNLSLIAELSDEDYSKMLKKVQESPIKIETVNLFFPITLCVVGEKRDMSVLIEYTQKALARAAELGVKVAVFGCGFARRVPEGYSYQKALAELSEVLKMCADVAAPLGITIVIEPLRREEVNLINTVAEGLSMCKELNHPNIKCLADFYHVVNNGESLDAISTAGDMLAHIHIARPTDRKAPISEEDKTACCEWNEALKTCGYNSRVSLECIFDSNPQVFEETIKSARSVLECFNK